MVRWVAEECAAGDWVASRTVAIPTCLLLLTVIVNTKHETLR